MLSLDLSFNNISDISFLKDLKQLQSLQLSENNISDISPILPLIKKSVPIKWENDYSKCISLEKNPLVSPPIEIIKRGNEAVINYFEELEKQGVDNLYEAKLLIIGDGGTGKTTMARRLIKADASMPLEKDTTKGIDIKQIHFKTNKRDDFTINIWDFGGQEIYHTTHQFFLTKRSLYILVDDTRKDDSSANSSSFNYWLQTVELLGGNSPLLIIQNQKGDRSKEIDLKSIQNRFDFIKDKYAANFATIGALEQINEAIQFHIQSLSHIGEPLPKQWVVIRNELIKKSTTTPYIDLNDYLEICAKHQITDRDKALQLSLYLHDLGTFLHFQRDAILKKTIILQNEWATEAVYKILDHEKTKANHGLVQLEDLDSMWQDSTYCDMQGELLALMKNFELCYELPDTNGQQLLIPGLLSPSQPENYKWDTTHNIHLRYKYGFMPKGFLSRLIVRLNHLVKDLSKAWKTGVKLEMNESHAEVKEIYNEDEIAIRARGPQRKTLMGRIAEEMDRIHSTFEYIKVTKKIPCNCTTCSDLEIPHFFEYESDLIVRIKHNKETIGCKNPPFQDIDIHSLIYDVLEKPIKIMEDEKDGFDEHEAEIENEPVKIFISYSHKDEDYKKELDTHLSSLKIQGKITVWQDRNIKPGEEWNESIFGNIDSSNIFLALISPDFIASDFCYNKELKHALELRSQGKLKIIPVIIRHSDWTDLPFAKIQAIPRDNSPIASLDKTERDEAYLKVINEIKAVIY